MRNYVVQQILVITNEINYSKLFICLTMLLYNLQLVVYTDVGHTSLLVCIAGANYDNFGIRKHYFRV